MCFEPGDVCVADQMRLERQLARKGKRRLLGGSKYAPVSVESGDPVVIEPGRQQLLFLVPEAVMAVVDARYDPEQLGRESIIENLVWVSLPRISLRTEPRIRLQFF